MKRIFSWFILGITLIALHSSYAQTIHKPAVKSVAEFSTQFPYRAYEVKDALGRTINFYLSDADTKDNRPLILVLQGSGCASNFLLSDGKVAGSWFAFVRRAAKDKAQVLLVDKPGVKLFDFPANPGDTTTCTDDFRREHTGERWMTALAAAVAAVNDIRGTAPRATLVLGHSEGGVIAPRLAAQSAQVTHAASLASAPVSQLHDFVDMADTSTGLFATAQGSKSQHLANLLDSWATIRNDPSSDAKRVYGHTHRYWMDKFAPVDYGKIAASKARLFLAYGDRDENSAPRKMDQFAVEMMIRNVDLTWIRVPGADHGFAQKGEPLGNGMQPMIERAVAWFLNEPFDRSNLLWPRSAGPTSQHK